MRASRRADESMPKTLEAKGMGCSRLEDKNVHSNLDYLILHIRCPRAPIHMNPLPPVFYRMATSS